MSADFDLSGSAPPPPPPPVTSPPPPPSPPSPRLEEAVAQATTPPAPKPRVTEVSVQLREVHYTEANGVPSRGYEVVVGLRAEPEPGTSAAANLDRLHQAARAKLAAYIQEAK